MLFKKCDAVFINLPEERVNDIYSAVRNENWHFMKEDESRIPEGFIEKKPEMGGVSAVKFNI